MDYLRALKGIKTIVGHTNIVILSRVLDSIDILINDLQIKRSDNHIKQTVSNIDARKNILKTYRLTDVGHTFPKNYIHAHGIPYNRFLSIGCMLRMRIIDNQGQNDNTQVKQCRPTWLMEE